MATLTDRVLGKAKPTEGHYKMTRDDSHSNEGTELINFRAPDEEHAGYVPKITKSPKPPPKSAKNSRQPRRRYRFAGKRDDQGRMFKQTPATRTSAYAGSGYSQIDDNQSEREFLGLDFHVDAFGRELETREIRHIDQYINPKDRRLRELVVQCAPRTYNEPNETTWIRTPMKNASPIALRTAAFCLSLGIGVVFWPLACVALFVLMLFPVGTGKVLYGGKYPPFHYRFNGYPKSAANKSEESSSALNTSRPSNGQNTSGPMVRILRPQLLDFVDPPGPEENGGSQTMAPEKWLEENPSRSLEYIFFAWTFDQFDVSVEAAYWDLKDLAVKITRQAKVPAFYLSSTCISKADAAKYSKPTTADVWQLNDVVRGAKSVVILVRTPRGVDATTVDMQPRDALLAQFAARVWTFPEILLAPANQDLLIYNDDETVENESFDDSLPEPYPIAKKQFSAQVWERDDARLARVARQLIDHFEGNLVLTRLQLPVLALACLYWNNFKGTQHFKGDGAYALSGLLSIRPEVVESDSEFQAFARLSLANDSDHLLERLVCILPASSSQPWHDTTDAWDVQLWDITPRCQVSAIGHDDTVILDNAYAAAIQWKSFSPVAEVTGKSILRTLAVVLIHTIVPLGLVLGTPLLAIGAATSSSSASPYGDTEEEGGALSTLGIVGAIVLALTGLILLSLPWLVKKVFGGKAYNVQAWLFGFEGYMPLENIEMLIWAEKKEKGGLSWSPFSSLLSRHEVDQYYQCVGVDPTNHTPLEKLEAEAAARNEKIFTLVDTMTMTVTMFTAARPPVALLICGSEGGMQRAVGVSYDWTTKTLYRETVLRLPTSIIERMHRVQRFRFGFRRYAETEALS